MTENVVNYPELGENNGIRLANKELLLNSIQIMNMNYCTYGLTWTGQNWLMIDKKEQKPPHIWRSETHVQLEAIENIAELKGFSGSGIYTNQGLNGKKPKILT